MASCSKGLEFLHYILCIKETQITAVRCFRYFAVDPVKQRQHLLPTHHCDFISLDADIRASEVAQSGDGSDAGGVHQVPIVIQHVNVHSDLPHLNTDTLIITITTLEKLLLSVLLLCVCVCFTFSPDTTHRDSVSMHLEFLKHLSSCLFNFTDNSDCLERKQKTPQTIYTLCTHCRTK